MNSRLSEIPVVFAIALGIYNVFLVGPKIKDSFIFAFQCGAATAYGIMAAILVLCHRIILNDERN